MKFLSIPVSLLVPLQCFGQGTYHFYFPPTTKLREGNVFSHVSLSVCLFMGVGPHHTGPQPPSLQGFGPVPVQGLALPPWTCSNLFKLDLNVQEPPLPDMSKLVHYVAWTVGKQTVGI